MPPAPPPPLILIGGPTAAGKSAFALQKAREVNGVILNADAMQIYRGLPLLTAQPDAQDKNEIPHRLYEVLDAASPSSVGKWLELTRLALQEAVETERAPILVGGTGLYFEAFQKGLADIPAISDSVRVACAERYEAEGEEKFREELATQDPESAARIARNDRQRLIRAAEVLAYTGKSLSLWQKEAAPRSLLTEFGFALPETHLICPPREALYAACDARFLQMIERGALEEVRTLLTRGLSLDLPAMKILGVREIAAFLQGEITLETAISQAQQKTRNYAKRQMTWFRHHWPKGTQNR